MSVTLVSRPDTPRASKPDPLERFDELLFENAEICSQCFARIRDREEHDTNTLGTGNRPTETLQRSGDGIAGHAIEDINAYGTKRRYTTRTFCGECGSQSGRAIGDHIHSLQSLRHCLDNIARRLHETGFYPDLQTLYGTAITLKQKPDHQGKDREILAVATHLAIERGSEARRPGRPTVGPEPSCLRR